MADFTREDGSIDAGAILGEAAKIGGDYVSRGKPAERETRGNPSAALTSAAAPSGFDLKRVNWVYVGLGVAALATVVVAVVVLSKKP